MSKTASLWNRSRDGESNCYAPVHIRSNANYTHSLARNVIAASRPTDGKDPTLGRWSKYTTRYQKRRDSASNASRCSTRESCSSNFCSTTASLSHGTEALLKISLLRKDKLVVCFSSQPSPAGAFASNQELSQSFSTNHRDIIPSIYCERLARSFFLLNRAPSSISLYKQYVIRYRLILIRCLNSSLV